MSASSDNGPAGDGPADLTVVPRSVAVIMDGNGRWAKRAGFERIRGHERGIDAVRTTVTECARLGVEALVLYAFSEENWARPKREVDMLFRLLKRFLVDERGTLMDNDVRLLHAGRRERLSPDVLKLLDETIALTADNQGMRLSLAISYGGQTPWINCIPFCLRALAAGTPTMTEYKCWVTDTIRAAGAGAVLDEDLSWAALEICRNLRDPIWRTEAGRRARGLASHHAFDHVRAETALLDAYHAAASVEKAA